MDSAYEIRSMILTVLPYPPLPVEVHTVEETILGEESVTTSHAILSQLLQIAAKKDDPTSNRERKFKQIDVFRGFLHAMAVEGFDSNGTDLYKIYCEYTKKHIETYFDIAEKVELKFKPLSYISKGDATHERMCEYMAGQSIIFEDPVPKSAELYKHKSYACLLEITRDRLGHTMSDEELERANEIHSSEDGQQLR